MDGRIKRKIKEILESYILGKPVATGYFPTTYDDYEVQLRVQLPKPECETNSASYFETKRRGGSPDEDAWRLSKTEEFISHHLKWCFDCSTVEGGVIRLNTREILEKYSLGNPVSACCFRLKYDEYVPKLQAQFSKPQ